MPELLPAREPDAGREAWIAAGLVLAATLGLVAHCVWMATPVADDSAISLAYGLTFFEGHGLRLTPASQPVEGFSNPLWTLLIGLSRPLRAEPVAFMRTLGIVLGVLALPVLALWGPASRGRRLRVEDAAGPLLVACIPGYVTWISSGMETGLQALLLVLSGALWLRDWRHPRSASSGVALGLLCVTRPEGVLYAAAAGGLWAVCRAWERRWPGGRELRLGAGVVLPWGLWLGVRWVYFADLLPNTYYAKRFWDLGARGYLEGFVALYTPLCVLVGLGLVLGCLSGGPGGRRSALLALFLGMGVLFVFIAQGDWMNEWRFLAPLLPLMGGALAAGLSGLRERWGPWRGLPLRGALLLGGGVLLGLAGLTVRTGLTRAPVVKAGPTLPYEYIASVVKPLRPTLGSLAQVRPLVAFADMGGLAMTLREAEIIDVAGLADYAVAHHFGNPRAQEDYLLSEGPPLLLDVHGPSLYLREFTTLLSTTRPLMGDFHILATINPVEDPRCPNGRSADLALETAALTRLLEQMLMADQAQDALRHWRCALAYRSPGQLPDRETRTRLANLADARGDALLQAGQGLLALRQFSLATLLDDGNAHRRRKTEQQRSRLFPRER